jgi:predicted RNA polymerase sigma factor
VRTAGNIDLAQECVQDAYARALSAWRATGVPRNAGAWLTTVARRLALDALRRQAVLVRSLPMLAADHSAGDCTTDDSSAADDIPDDRLRLILTCCHPALAFETQVALTLRLICGLSTADVARAFELTRMLRHLLPRSADVAGLLALLLLTDARRATRVDAGGRLLLLSDQDRTLWDRATIAEGAALVRESLASRPPGRYALMAAIAAVHCDAAQWADTDWDEIVALYDVLLTVWSSPVVELNRAVAIGFARGPVPALLELDRLAADPRLAGYGYLAAARADFLARLGRLDEARTAYEEAVLLTGNEVERAFLADRLGALGS